MFGLFKKKQKQPNNDKEFTFIWYKKMKSGNKTHYTSPFRTKIKAKNKEEAMKKMTDFALSKMTLHIIEEKDFETSDLMNFQKQFDDLNSKFQESIKKMFK